VLQCAIHMRSSAFGVRHSGTRRQLSRTDL
jgi:hypothetical protein